MTLEEFWHLPVYEQAQHAWDYGRYLMNWEGQRPTANQYAVSAFYVEIWYDQESNNITAITRFGKVSKLDTYLNAISLGGLG